MNSKEALDKLYDNLDCECCICDDCKFKLTDEKRDYCYLWYNTIKQDLDSLEEIIKVWYKNEPMESVCINGNHLQELYDFHKKLFEENQKLEKVINILKEICSLNCDKTLETERQFLKLSQEEYELLKEVLNYGR